MKLGRFQRAWSSSVVGTLISNSDLKLFATISEQASIMISICFQLVEYSCQLCSQFDLNSNKNPNPFLPPPPHPNQNRYHILASSKPEQIELLVSLFHGCKFHINVRLSWPCRTTFICSLSITVSLVWLKYFIWGGIIYYELCLIFLSTLQHIFFR